MGGVAGALMATSNMQMQTFVAEGLGDENDRMKRKGILCLNDQGGAQMDCTCDQTATLRAQMRGHQPLVFDNHGLDSRYSGPCSVAQTMSAAYGMGGNNTSLVVEPEPARCITGNATDHHAVFSRQRTDKFRADNVASTQSARQHKDATDLVLCPADPPQLIRRLTPLECERLQGFPDGWTDISGAADSARYKALGNSVAIPCVEYLLRGVAYFLQKHETEPITPKGSGKTPAQEPPAAGSFQSQIASP